MTGAPITFAAVAQPLAKQGWRPFPGYAGQQDAGDAGLAWSQRRRMGRCRSRSSHWRLSAGRYVLLLPRSTARDRCHRSRHRRSRSTPPSPTGWPMTFLAERRWCGSASLPSRFAFIEIPAAYIRASYTRSKSSQAPVNSSPSAGTRRQTVRTSGRMPLHSLSAPTATPFRW